jgi:hypothetical protein
MRIALGAPWEDVRLRVSRCDSLAPDRRLCVVSDTVSIVVLRDSVVLVHYTPRASRPRVAAEVAWARWRPWATRAFGPPDSVIVRRHPRGRALYAYWRSGPAPALDATLVASEVTSVDAGPHPDSFTQVSVGLGCRQPRLCRGP